MSHGGSPPDRGGGAGPDLTREFLKFYLRPAYLLDVFRSGADPAASFRLFAGFLSGMLSFFAPPGKVTRN